jgi:S-DNA-T family DNA segregation ATPase FtsK/SpoIIIE
VVIGRLPIFATMADRLKSKKGRKPGTGSLRPEQVQKLPLKQIARDGRLRKMLGALFLLTASFLFISFSSYLFTWSEDQDKVRSSSILLPGSHAKVANLMGSLGAYLSNQFFYNGFGLASYLFCSFFFVVGVNWLFSRRIFSLSRNARYLLLGLPIGALALSFFTNGSSFFYGGAVGNLIRDWLNGLIGRIGTAALLLALALVFIIWRFNPAFMLPALKRARPSPLPQDPGEAGGAKLFIQVPPNQQAPHWTDADNPENPVSPGPDPALDLHLVEREDSKGGAQWTPKELPAQTGKGSVQPPRPQPELELEIKAVPAEPAQETKIGGPLADYEPTWDLKDYVYPTLDLLDAHGSEKIVQDAGELEANKTQIIETLKNYDISIQKISATVGPTVTLYEIVPERGVRISRIRNLEDDIALSLSALGIRIIAPIPGKGTIGIEVPNAKKTLVSMRTLLSSEKFQHNSYQLPIAIGKKIDNEHFIVDLTAMPHLLMAGATGQGKSVGLNAILVSLLYKKHPSQLKFVLVDPKKVELSLYRIIEKYFLIKISADEEPIITDTKKVIYTLNALCEEMDQRYDYLKEAACRNIREYNEKFVKRKLNPELGHKYLPFIVLIIDEFADLIMTAGKEIELPLARLAQLARAVGIHLILATQRPSVNIITGTIKANFPARIAFKVSSKIDSRTILDMGGSEQLIGKGDMLVSYNGEITRVQCAFVDTPEVERVCDFIADQRGFIKPYELPKYEDEREIMGKDFDRADHDDLFEEAARLIVQNQVGSTSLLQRRMKLGYNRAGRLMDQLEAAGIVGPSQGSKAREVLFKSEIDLEFYLGGRRG